MDIFNTLLFQPIFNILFAIYGLIPGHDLGVAIIIFTILVRFALWPLARKQLHHSKIMKEMQPKLAEIKKKAKGNRQLESMMMMDLYKKQGVNPFSGIGMLLLQMPFFIALYTTTNWITDAKNLHEHTYGFLQGIPHIKEVLADPTKLNDHFLGFVDLTKTPLNDTVTAAMFMVVLAAVVGYLQFKQSKQLLPQTGEKKSLKQLMKDQAEGKQVPQMEIMAATSGKMIYFFPVFLILIIISIHSGLGLYMATTTVFGFLQQRHIFKEDSDEMDKIADEKPKNTSVKTKSRVLNAQEAEIITPVTKPNTQSKAKKSAKKRRK